MTRGRFVRLRKASWVEFELLLQRVESRRLKKLTGIDVSNFSALFRAVCHDLATVRSREWGHELDQFLNDLVVRGHNSFYRAPPGRSRELSTFLLSGFPRLVRENARYFWTACLLFVLPTIISAAAMSADPTLVGRVLTAEQMEQFDLMYSESAADRGEEGGRSHGQGSLMAGFYIRNNVGVAFRCFATGIFFGLGTAFFLVFNGIFMGAVSTYLVQQGHSDAFFSFVISHGSFELTAIVIAGMGGLILGHAIIHPGSRTRLEALKVRGGVAIRLAAGAGVFLVIAAFIEGFWSPYGVPSLLKYAIGSLLWLLVIGYLLLPGRGEAPA